MTVGKKKQFDELYEELETIEVTNQKELYLALKDLYRNLEVCQRDSESTFQLLSNHMSFTPSIDDLEFVMTINEDDLKVNQGFWTSGNKIDDPYGETYMVVSNLYYLLAEHYNIKFRDTVQFIVFDKIFNKKFNWDTPINRMYNLFGLSHEDTGELDEIISYLLKIDPKMTLTTALNEVNLYVSRDIDESIAPFGYIVELAEKLTLYHLYKRNIERLLDGRMSYKKYR